MFANEVFRRLRAGERTKGYVVQVRADGNVDHSLYAPERKRMIAIEDDGIRLLEDENWSPE